MVAVFRGCVLGRVLGCIMGCVMGWALGLSLASVLCAASDTPQLQQRLETGKRPQLEGTRYYWQASPVGDTAQLLTLFCRSCAPVNGHWAVNGLYLDVPLVAVLRDTLGDLNSENNRVSSVWLLTYSRPNLGRQMLSAVPFFFWRAGGGSSAVSSADIKPLFDLTAPKHPVLSEVRRDLFQWALFDPISTPVRATSRTYWANAQDHQREHLEEAITYLRQAPVSDDAVSSNASALTATQLDTVIARLELRKGLLGGLVTATRASSVGEESGYEDERSRSRNFELLRQCAEKTGLIFEPLNVTGASGQYAALWFPLNQSFSPGGAPVRPIWKLLNIRDPWNDDRLKQWEGPVYTRSLDDNGSLLPDGEAGALTVRLVPLGVYSLNYPTSPLLLVDFRNKLHVRWHEMTQRSINEITAGVIGISHFTNWYYYVGADLYDFVVARHGSAMNQAARLDSYAQFRVKLALDQDIDPQFRQQIQEHVNSLSLNPLEADAAREMQAALARYDHLQEQASPGGALMSRLDRQRRAELADFGQTGTARITHELYHAASFGLYTQRVRPDPEDLAILDRNRRLEHNLDFLDSLADAGTPPEVAYDSARIRASVNAVRDLSSVVSSPVIRKHVEDVLLRVKSLSQDKLLQSDCSLALASLRPPDPPLRAPRIAGVLTSRHPLITPSSGMDAGK